ncbi:MAG: MerR family transcriptional regulator [Bacteriovoracaceae bacterium]|jgi:DNA-binding transcriptional MerR regulator|nr:hypothetical protein [Halobacteriovoraceae bacterium]MDP7321172.1 MerR family transcriptional regulator [Bacteriovoracaceae bacterium]
MKYNITTISNICGVKAQTIRMWEKRYNVLKPLRDESGRRIYSIEDLEKVKLITRLIDSGETISAVANLSLTQLQSRCEKLFMNKVKENKDCRLSVERLLTSLKNYALEDFVSELQHQRLTLGVRDFLFSLCLPFMQQIGILVEENKYSVSQEHIASTLLREQLTQYKLPNSGAKELEFALATPEGNLHELSLVMADILCRSFRASTRYMGASHPAKCLGDALNGIKPPHLILGVLSSDKWCYEKEIAHYLKQIDERLDFQLMVFLGGGFPVKLPQFRKIRDVVFLESFEKLEKQLSLICS